MCVCLQRERARLGLAAATFVWKHGAAVTHMLEWQQYQPVPLNTIQKDFFCCTFMWIFATNVDIFDWITVLLLYYMYYNVDMKFMVSVFVIYIYFFLISCSYMFFTVFSMKTSFEQLLNMLE